ncbi:sigma-70 family RNA polymerase sigma factor [Azoarcus sp. TTM-91]|nr:sigma-70 family RNA polymerase sigma factor [Azoarcus sp. TTM-91]
MAEDMLSLLRGILVQRYERIRHSLALKLGSPDLAGDALHETWLRLEAANIAGPVKNPQAYLTRMAVNLAIDVKRAEGHMLMSSDEVDALMEMVPDPAPGPAKVAEDRAQLRELQDILSRMPPRRREILILVRWEGWAHKDVAHHLGVSVRVVEHELKAAQALCAARLSRRNGEAQ